MGKSWWETWGDVIRQVQKIGSKLELIEEIKRFRHQGVHGIHIMAVGWEEIVPRIVTEALLLPDGLTKPSQMRIPGLRKTGRY